MPSCSARGPRASWPSSPSGGAWRSVLTWWQWTRRGSGTPSAATRCEIAGPLTGKLVVVPSNPLTTDAHGNAARVLPKGQSSGKVVAGWFPAGACLAMASGTLSADLFESAVDRSPEPAVLFYATDDDRAGEEVERLIRTAGFEPVKAGGLGQSGRLEVGGDLHDLVVGPAQARSLIDGT